MLVMDSSFIATQVLIKYGC